MSESSEPRPGTLYLVSTPIGNMEDLSPRAQRILGAVDLIAAEDTRHTQGLLTRFAIRRALVSYHDHNKERRTSELIRLRIAFHNQCRSCMAIRYDEAVQDGVTEALVCSLERPAEADDLTDAERAALRYADLFATNHLAIDDAVYDDLRQYFTEGELVEIGLNCAIDVGVGRLTATWDVTDDLPDDFRLSYAETATPWNAESPLIVG